MNKHYEKKKQKYCKKCMYKIVKNYAKIKYKFKKICKKKKWKKNS